MKPGSNECLQYDTRYQAVTIDEAIGSFIDMTLEDDGRPAEKEKTEAEVSALFWLYDNREIPLGALPDPRVQGLSQTSQAASEEGGPAERVREPGRRCAAE